MTGPKLTLIVLDEILTICRLDRDAPIPEWAMRGSFVSITRTSDELSIVCSQPELPPDTAHESGWCCFQVVGPLAFSMTGVLVALSRPLAEAGISIFAISTFDTDYLLVKADDLSRAIVELTVAGHTVHG
jgi:uncharacterized protein